MSGIKAANQGVDTFSEKAESDPRESVLIGSMTKATESSEAETAQAGAVSDPDTSVCSTNAEGRSGDDSGVDGSVRESVAVVKTLFDAKANQTSSANVETAPLSRGGSQFRRLLTQSSLGTAVINAVKANRLRRSDGKHIDEKQIRRRLMARRLAGQFRQRGASLVETPSIDGNDSIQDEGHEQARSARRNSLVLSAFVDPNEDSTRSKEMLRQPSTQPSEFNSLDVDSEIEIAYKIITQNEILETYRNSGYLGRIMAFLYPYFPPEAYSQRSKCVELFIMALVILNVIVMIISTEPTIVNASTGGSVQRLFDSFEYFCFSVFVIEYMIRIWVCILDEQFYKRGVFGGRINYLISINSLIDLTALIPSFIEVAHRASFPAEDESLGMGSGIRLWRILRIVKLEHYTNATYLLKRGFKKQAHLFQLVLTYPVVAWLMFATLLSFTETLENNSPEETVVHFKSIPRALFPTLLMLTGEAPILEFSLMGKFVASIISIFAMVIMATVTGIIASGFEQAMIEQDFAKRIGFETRRALKNHIKAVLADERSSGGHERRRK